MKMKKLHDDVLSEFTWWWFLAIYDRVGLECSPVRRWWLFSRTRMPFMMWVRVTLVVVYVLKRIISCVALIL